MEDFTTQLEVGAHGPRSPVETCICEPNKYKWKAMIVYTLPLALEMSGLLQ